MYAPQRCPYNTRMQTTRTLRSPLGDLLATAEIADHGHSLTALSFAAARGPESSAPSDAAEFFERVEAELDGYFAGSRREFDIPVKLAGTAFQLRVWEALRAIPHGSTRTYADIAAELGNPKATRAVGAANGRNPICIIVPCHRVIATGGGLGGYSGTLERKRRLLELEGGACIGRELTST